MEKLGRQDADEGAVVAKAGEPPAGALGNQLGDRARLEVSGVVDCSRREALADIGRRAGAGEALAVGRAVGLLRSVADRCRHERRHGFAENVFFAQAAELEPRRDFGGKFDDAMVEEGKTALDRMRHGNTVALRRQDVAGQEIGGLQILGLGEVMPADEIAGKAGAEIVERVIAGGRLAECRREEDIGAGGRAEPRQVREERIAEGLIAGGEEGFAVAPRLPLQGREIGIEALQKPRPELRLRLAGAEAAELGLLEDVIAGEDLVGAFAGLTATTASTMRSGAA